MAGRKRLGDILQERGLLNEEQLQAALKMQRSTGEKLGSALVKLGYVTPDQMADALSDHLGIERVDLSRQYISAPVVSLVPEEILRSYQVLPLSKEDNLLTIAMTDPLNIVIIDELQRITGMLINPVIATDEEIENALDRVQDISATAKKVFAEYVDEQEETVQDEQFLDDAPGVRLANMILQQAVRDKASDVHLEPGEEELEVRYRVDGILQRVMTVPKKLRNDVISRIKIMSNLDITERRRPQDGRIQARVDNVEVDMRISTLPTIHGEKIVARVLNKSQGVVSVEQLGFSETSTQQALQFLRLNQGLILVTGPTGSGKTTTLYAFLEHLNTVEKNIITIEDPVEYQMDGINQVQINTKVGLTFATGLRSILRQDPDIVMVGEIRDNETAEIAVRSALTGHLVFSTLHTNNTIASIARLMDMKVEPYLISSTVSAIVSQRLVRKICSECRVEVPLKDSTMIHFMESMGITLPEHVYQGRGCPLCKDTGYRGRVAIEEVLIMNKKLREAIEQRATENELRKIAIANGMVTLQQNAVEKLLTGKTTASEIIRTVYSIDEQEALM